MSMPWVSNAALVVIIAEFYCQLYPRCRMPNFEGFYVEGMFLRLFLYLKVCRGADESGQIGQLRSQASAGQRHRGAERGRVASHSRAADERRFEAWKGRNVEVRARARVVCNTFCFAIKSCR